MRADPGKSSRATRPARRCVPQEALLLCSDLLGLGGHEAGTGTGPGASRRGGSLSAAVREAERERLQVRKAPAPPL